MACGRPDDHRGQDVMRRSLLGLLAGMVTQRGDELVRPVNAPPSQQIPPGQAPGTPQNVFNTIFIIGAHGKILLYDPNRAAGNLVDSMAAVVTTDAGNEVLPGVTSYNKSFGGGVQAIQMFDGGLSMSTAASEAGPYTPVFDLDPLTDGAQLITWLRLGIGQALAL